MKTTEIWVMQGDIVQIGEGKAKEAYIVACTDEHRYCLISLTDGNRWSTPRINNNTEHFGGREIFLLKDILGLQPEQWNWHIFKRRDKDFPKKYSKVEEKKVFGLKSPVRGGMR